MIASHLLAQADSTGGSIPTEQLIIAVGGLFAGLGIPKLLASVQAFRERRDESAMAMAGKALDSSFNLAENAAATAAKTAEALRDLAAAQGAMTTLLQENTTGIAAILAHLNARPPAPPRPADVEPLTPIEDIPPDQLAEIRNGDPT